MKFGSVFAKATSLKILQTLCLVFRNKWWYAKLIPIFASAVKLLKYYFEEPQSCPRWMLQKCLKLRGSWIAQDLVCLIVHYLQCSDVLDDGPELVVLSFLRTAWKKTLYLLKNFQRRKEWAVSCRKSLSLVCCQKDMEPWTPAAHRPRPLDHAANNEQALLSADLNCPMVSNTIYIHTWDRPRRDVEAGCFSGLLLLFATYADGWWQCPYCTSVPTDCSCRKAM